MLHVDESRPHAKNKGSCKPAESRLITFWQGLHHDIQSQIISARTDKPKKVNWQIVFVSCATLIECEYSQNFINRAQCVQKVRSETEIINHHFIHLLSFQLYSVLCWQPFHVNRLKGNGRAYVLTSATTNTYLRPDLGDGECSLVGYHVYRLGGTVF